MKLFYYQSEFGNFGDDLNPWLWDRLLPGFFDEDASEYFVGIGTLLNHKLPRQGRKIIFGSGMGYGDKPQLDKSWDIAFVRGPLTAKALGLDVSYAITDGAILLKDILLPAYKKQYPISFVPHHVSAREADWKKICDQAGVHYIAPELGPDAMFAELLQSEHVLCEAMHGAICCDILRIPWTAVSCYQHILPFKWQDWCASMEMDYQPQYLPSVWDQDRLFCTHEQLKLKVKRRLLNTPLWKAQWDEPPKREKPAKEYTSAIEAMQRLKDSALPNLSKDSVLQNRWEMAHEKLQGLKQKTIKQRELVEA